MNPMLRQALLACELEWPGGHMSWQTEHQRAACLSSLWLPGEIVGQSGAEDNLLVPCEAMRLLAAGEAPQELKTAN